MGADAMTAHLYPRMFAIHNLADAIGSPESVSESPSLMRPTYILMDGRGIYLIGKWFS